MSGAPPAWATSWGEDRFGVWAGFEIGGVEQRMRWIEGGRFVMGSPESEAGRDGDEQQHEVELSGFWLGETPVTQALWKAVTIENPSRFKSPDRPVESVSWIDCDEFTRRIGALAPELELRLPTEAEWEYACRGGTTTSTYAGELEIAGERNGPILDEIAWYSGNSGVGFELENGYDSSSWPNKQHEHSRAGSRSVGTKLPNAFGLHDMLGNVWEWCADWHATYPRELTVNPQGSPRGGARVLRGGSWDSNARNVRAAARRSDHPGIDDDRIGVRLARGQG